MEYKGTRFSAYIGERKGTYAEISEKMKKYKKPKGKNKEKSNETPYRIETLYKDGLNITLGTLTALMKETGLPVNFFIDFEEAELPSDSSIKQWETNDNSERVRHLEEIIKLKDEIIALKDSKIESLNREIELTRTKLGHS